MKHNDRSTATKLVTIMHDNCEYSYTFKRVGPTPRIGDRILLKNCFGFTTGTVVDVVADETEGYAPAYTFIKGRVAQLAARILDRLVGAPRPHARRKVRHDRRPPRVHLDDLEIAEPADVE